MYLTNNTVDSILDVFGRQGICSLPSLASSMVTTSFPLSGQSHPLIRNENQSKSAQKSQTGAEPSTKACHARLRPNPPNFPPARHATHVPNGVLPRAQQRAPGRGAPRTPRFPICPCPPLPLRSPPLPAPPPGHSGRRRRGLVAPGGSRGGG